MESKPDSTGAPCSSQVTPVCDRGSQDVDEKLALYLEEKRQGRPSSQPSEVEKGPQTSVSAQPERSNSGASINGSVANLPAPRYQGQGTQEDPYIVDWDEDDPENPYNWSRLRRWLLTGQVKLTRSIILPHT